MIDLSQIQKYLDILLGVLDTLLKRSGELLNLLNILILLGLGGIISAVFRRIFSKKKPDAVRMFSEDTDYKFVEQIIQDIDSAQHTVVFIGLGHTMLRHNDSLKKQIVKKIHHTPSIYMEFYYAPIDDALLCRVKEEKLHFAKTNRNYDENWPVEYFENFKHFLDKNVQQKAQSRVALRRLAYFPMFYLIQIDNIFYSYMYGVPSIRGPEAPWFRFNHESSPEYLKHFFQENVNFARRNLS